MAITDIQLDEFIQLYFDKYGIQLDRQAAYEEACKLVQLVRIVCFGKPPAASPIPDEMIQSDCQTQGYNKADSTVRVERIEG